MKASIKFLKISFLAFLVTFILFTIQASQVVPIQPASTVEVPGSTGDILLAPDLWFASTGSVAGMVIYLTFLIARRFPGLKAWHKQAIAHSIAMGLVVFGSLVHIGFMAYFKIIPTIVYGIIIGFIANGLYDMKSIIKPQTNEPVPKEANTEGNVS
jgi:hypothetical protein